MFVPRILVALVAISSFAFFNASGQCTAQQGLITVTLDNADPGLFTYSWTILNSENGNGNRLQDVFFEIVNADTASTASAVASWTKAMVPVDGSWTALQFSHAAGPRICSGGGSCSSSTETFTYTLDQMISNVRIRATQANGHSEDFAFDPSMQGCGSLPIELASFNALINEQTVTLRWQTASEQDAAGFDIERRDAGEFSHVTFVPAVGASTTGHEYQFDDFVGDRRPEAYRLKLLDVDGTFEYSSVVELARDVEQALTLSPSYPNPFISRTTFSVAVAREQHVRVDVYDAAGRRVAVAFEGPVRTSQPVDIQLEASGLAPGLYFIRAVSGEAAVGRSVLLID